MLQGVAIALGLVLLVGGFALIAVDYRPYNVPTDSMEPTVHPGDTVLARRSNGSDVGRGDVVVFKDSTWGSALLVKRIVGVGGDTLVCCDAKHRLVVNGVAVDEPYLAGGYNSGKFSVTVPRGRIFLMGDNRLGSLDSRVHLDQASGTVPAGDVLGRVEGTAWPFGRMGGIDRTAAFDPVGGAVAAQHGPLVPASWAAVAGAVLVLVTAAVSPVAGFLRRLRRGGR
nr:signal peptidase I [Peterkaempfera griseoplana]